MKGNIACAPRKATKAGEAIISCFKMAQNKVVVHPSEDKIDAKFKNDEKHRCSDGFLAKTPNKKKDLATLSNKATFLWAVNAL